MTTRLLARTDHSSIGQRPSNKPFRWPHLVELFFMDILSYLAERYHARQN